MTINHREELEALSPLSANQQARAIEQAKQLQLTSYEEILQFGTNTQKKLAGVSNRLLQYTQQKDLIKIGDILTELLTNLQIINVDFIQPKQTWWHRLFKKTPASIQQTMTQFKKIEIQIDRLAIQLEYAYKNLLKTMDSLDELYVQSQQYAEDIVIHVAVANLKKQEFIKLLPSLQEQALHAKDLLVHQQIEDFSARIEQLAQRIDDLELSKLVACQTAPQIRYIQQTYEQLLEKIQSSILTTIPVWKNQISILFTMQQQYISAYTERRLVTLSNTMMEKKTKLSNELAKATSFEQHHTNNELVTFNNTQQALLNMLKDTIQLQTTSNEIITEMKQMLSK